MLVFAPPCSAKSDQPIKRRVSLLITSALAQPLGRELQVQPDLVAGQAEWLARYGLGDRINRINGIRLIASGRLQFLGRHYAKRQSRF